MNRMMVPLVLLAVVAAAGCGSNSESVVDPPVVIAEKLVGPTWHQVAWFDSYDGI